MGQANEPKYDKIVKKVKGLLAISKDQKNDEESQSAFVLAQKLMIQYNINKIDVEDSEVSTEIIGEDSVTIYKKLFWWERQLAIIIAENFRVKNFISSKRLSGSMHQKRKIVFYGMEKDLELAKEMYLLAYEIIVFHSKKFINDFYLENDLIRERYYTESLKSSYIRGFLIGLDNKFKEQVSELRKSYELVVLMPKEVEDAYKIKTESFGKPLETNIPPVEIIEAYKNGLKQGGSVDFTKSSIYTDYSSLVGKCIRFSQGVTSDLQAKVTRVDNDTLYMIVVNTTSNGALKGRPSVYEWELPVSYDFDFVNESDIEFIENSIKKEFPS
ncbi:MULTISPECIES: DUF2786 domain-containing protein [Vagococcus]|uniref:Uncharacterized protein n=1 Tax=Vagococcus fluvialis bH819 TaxID=1255619 RepID=A0A1X6WRZ0_9ENTE|nr:MULTISPECIES: DUF2786 domain-containing protein [Vagococcus]SLM87121.1 hypothetical protein FM121_13565 [Vagococcus fluvialis bH819]HCM90600.1 DUF2786 domain-containing protein [Vagococcus sp.]